MRGNPSNERDRGGDMHQFLAIKGRVALAILASLVLMAGCADSKQEPSKSVGPSTNQTAPTNSDQFPSPSIIPTPRSGLNLTDCDGASFNFKAPIALVQDDLPQGFKPNGDVVSPIEIYFNDCRKSSVNGVDMGPASFVVVAAALKAPAGAPPGNHLASWFVLETHSNRTEVRQWLTAALKNSGTATVSHKFTPQPAALVGEATSRALDNGTPLYSATSYPDKDFDSQDWLIRWYYGPNVTRDFWEMRHVNNVSESLGPGNFTAASGSSLARALNGATQWAGEGVVQNSIYRTLRAWSQS